MQSTSLIFLVLLCASSGWALDCYQCTSVSDSRCLDDQFDATLVPVLSCEMAAPGSRSKFVKGPVDGPACVRYDGTDPSGERYTVRGCSPYGSATCGATEIAANNEGSNLEYCSTCTEAKCNSMQRPKTTQKEASKGIWNYLTKFF